MLPPDGGVLDIGRDTTARPTEVLAIVAAEDDELLIMLPAIPLEW